MGRKLDVSNLKEVELNQILHVIQRDFDLRNREKDRLLNVESELNEEKAAEQVIANQKQYNERHCIRCCSAFNFLFNKKLSCYDCTFCVCRNCATWDSNKKSWICSVCVKQRALRNQSCEWFYDHIRHKFKRFGGAKVVRSLYKRRAESDSENDSGYDPSTSVCSREGSEKKSRPLNDASNSDRLTTTEIHRHIEALVEGLVGEALDNAHIDKVYKHPEYKSDGPEDPTSAHVVLKQIIYEVVQEAMKLPCLQDSGNASASSPTSSESHEEDIENHNNFEELEDFASYEDVLASAILNKVIEQYQKKTKTEETGTDTDDLQHSTETVISNHISNLVADRDNIANNNCVKSSVDVGIQSGVPSDQDDECSQLATSSLGDESANEDFTWAKQDNSRDPIAYVIEEQIEEITTETYNTDSEDEQKYESPLSGSPPGVSEPIIPKCQVLNEFTLPELDHLHSGLDFLQTHKIPFPELGMDIVDLGDDDGENFACDTTSTVITPIGNWEENWLFRKKKRSASYGIIGHRHLGCYDDPICMLIPNPTETIPTKVGSLDIDELSDLSEHNSVGSLEYSSCEESADEDLKTDTTFEQPSTLPVEIVPEVSQKNLEHTIDYYKESDKLHQPYRPIPKKRKTAKPTKETSQNHVDEVFAPSTITQVPLQNVTSRRKTSIPIPKFIHTKDRKSPNAHNEIAFFSEPESITVHSGKTARIFAQINGKQPFDVVWFHNGSLIKDGGRFQVYWCNGNKFCLDIFDTDGDDAGPYSCVAFNDCKKSIWADFHIKIKSSSRAENPPEFVSKLEDQSVIDGSPVRLSCKVSGYPEPQLIFYFKNKKIQNDDEYYIDNLGYGDWTIEIPSAKLSHNGLITACARNKVGEVQSSVKIIVEPNSNKKELNSLTKRVNKAQKDIEIETQNLLDTASQQASANALRRTTGRALDVINKTTNSGLKQSLLHSKEPLAFSTPPKPGTIADREHRKWLQADVQMPNNPYTSENVARRRSSILSNGLPCSNTPGSQQDHDVVIPSDNPQKIDCGLKQIESERYERDYYVNGNPVPTQRKTNPPKPKPRKANNVSVAGKEVPPSEEMTNETLMNDKLNIVEEKVYLSAGKVYSLEDRIRQLESQVKDVDIGSNLNDVNELEDKVALAVAQVTQNDKSVSKVEEEVARIRQEIIEESELARKEINSNQINDSILNDNFNGDFKTVDNNSNFVNEEDVPSLPSVKDLATKFKSEERCPTSSSSMPVIMLKSKKETPVLEKDVILVEKTDPNYSIPPNQIKESGLKPKQEQDFKVHSLTARMVSKEFREQVRMSNPSQQKTFGNSYVPHDDVFRAQSPTENSSNGLDSSDSRMTSPSPVAGEPFQHGYTSDESTTSSNSLCPNDKPKRKATRSILNRATYWERRAEQGLLSDCSVGEDFPSFTQVPN